MEFFPLSISGHANLVKLIIENGGNVNAEDQDKKTPLHLAASGGNST